MRGWAVLLVACASASASLAQAEPADVDRAVVRFSAPEIGGVERPRFITERTLAFEARLEALADQDARALEPNTYRERHVSAALERHVAEVLLSSFRIEPEPTEATLKRQTELARSLLAQRVGGEERLVAAQRAEGVTSAELFGILRRQARASLYLDRMVAPMLKPSDAELESLQRSAVPELKSLPFSRARPVLLRYYVSRRMASALSSFYQEARSRLSVVVLTD